MAVIELENVEVAYKGLKALNGISCSLESGAIGLLGPNGAGKSTLIKTLLGFTSPAAGTVHVMGHPLPRKALEVRQHVGYMPEFEIVCPKVSAVSFLTMCGQLFGMSRPDAMERTHEVLNYVGMGENRYRMMETYSTGMLQRVKLGQALVHDPKLLFLDEPTNGLDPDGRVEMLELIRQISRRPNVTVLLCSHLLPDVQSTCSHVLMINRGRIVEEGSMASLTARRENEFEVRVRDHSPEFRNQLCEQGYTCTQAKEGAYRVHIPVGSTADKIFETALRCGTQVRHLEPAHSTLEETFMRMVEQEKQPEPADNHRN